MLDNQKTPFAQQPELANARNGRAIASRENLSHSLKNVKDGWLDDIDIFVDR